MLLFGDIKNKM